MDPGVNISQNQGKLFPGFLCDSRHFLNPFFISVSENLEISNREPRVLSKGIFICETGFIQTSLRDFPPLFIKVWPLLMGYSSPDYQKWKLFPVEKTVNLRNIYPWLDHHHPTPPVKLLGHFQATQEADF
jgi:hypothetical protein